MGSLEVKGVFSGEKVISFLKGPREWKESFTWKGSFEYLHIFMSFRFLKCIIDVMARLEFWHCRLICHDIVVLSSEIIGWTNADATGRSYPGSMVTIVLRQCGTFELKYPNDTCQNISLEYFAEMPTKPSIIVQMLPKTSINANHVKRDTQMYLSSEN